MEEALEFSLSKELRKFFVIGDDGETAGHRIKAIPAEVELPERHQEKTKDRPLTSCPGTKKDMASELFFDNVGIVSQGYHFSAIPMAPSTALSIRSPEEAYRFQIDPAAPAGLEAME